MSGIVSYGAYIPSHKIETGEIASVWVQTEAHGLKI